jgi:hypothetical protein
MSVSVTAGDRRTVTAELVAAVRKPSLTWRALIGSRLLVLLAGVGGVLTVSKHVGTGVTTAFTHQLGAVGYVLAGSADRFDSAFYLGIAAHGYGASAASTTAFYPLYPLAIRVIGIVVGSDVIAGVLISAACFAGALVLLHRLTELELGRRAADAAVLLLAFAPLSFFFTAVYTESIFLLLSVGAVFAARRERWMLAGVLGALAALTRPTGILLVVPIAIARLRRRRGLDRQLLWSLAPLVAVGFYLAMLAASGFSWAAPFHAEAYWHRVSVGPIIGVAAGIGAAVKGLAAIVGQGASIYDPTLLGPFSQSAESVLLLIVLVMACALLVQCFRRLPLEYGAYAALALAMCVSSPQIGQPLVSLDRYVLTIFPLWMVAGAWVAKRRLEAPAVVLGSILLVFYTVQFSSWSFVA